MHILLPLYNLLDRQTEFIRFIRYGNIVCARLMLTYSWLMTVAASRDVRIRDRRDW